MKKLTFRRGLCVALALLMLLTVPAFAADGSCDDGHSWGAWETVMPATCKTEGRQERTCSVCGSTSWRTVSISKNAHVWGEWVVTQPATCLETGRREQTCSLCGSTRWREIPLGAHTEQTIPGYPATATEDGLTDGVKCAVCGKILTEQEVIPATGSTPVVPPIISALLPALSEQVAGPFVDVAPMNYCYDAVNWAVENDITTGSGRYTFSPDEPCTRAQAATFLWRASGCPAPKSAATPFTDVDASAYYAEAVAWAVETGVTTGTTPTTFSPDAPCTRAQIVTFLYRAMGGETDAAAAFTDVALDAYYAPAVAWAAACGVTGGTTPATFSPDAVCTRGQIVTFLYRACAN